MTELPSFPKVHAQESLVIIEYENGKKYTWGEEKTVNEAAIVANQLEIELRLFEYIKNSLNFSMNDILTNLQDYPPELVSEILREVLVHNTRFTKY